MTAKERIEAAQKARDALAKSRLKDEEKQLEEQAAAEELALRNDKAVAEAQDKYGEKKVAVVQTDSDVIVLKQPDGVLFKKFQDETMSADKLSSDKIEKVVYSCVVYPDKSRFGAMLSDQPILAQRCLLAIADLAGAKRADLGGKY